MNYHSHRFPRQSIEKLMIIAIPDWVKRTSKQQPMRNTLKVSMTNQNSQIPLYLFSQLLDETPPGGLSLSKYKYCFPLWKFLKGFPLKRMLKNISSMIRIMAPGMKRTSQGLVNGTGQILNFIDVLVISDKNVPVIHF